MGLWCHCDEKICDEEKRKKDGLVERWEKKRSRVVWALWKKEALKIQQCEEQVI